jgi:hypothetical protein
MIYGVCIDGPTLQKLVETNPTVIIGALFVSAVMSIRTIPGMTKKS